MKNIDVGFVNFKTPKLTKICLKFLKKNVLDEVNKIFVVDNNSNDKSLQLLKKTKFIDLIERKEIDDNSYQAHGRALDAIVKASSADYLLIIHSDTFIFSNELISTMLKDMQKNKKNFVVGCLQQTKKSLLRKLSKLIKKFFRKYTRLILNFFGTNYRISNFKEVHIKSFCALYNLKLIKKYNLSFYNNIKETPSYHMQDYLEEKKFKRVVWSDKKMFSFLDHVEEGTRAEGGKVFKRPKRFLRYQSLINSASIKTS